MNRHKAIEVTDEMFHKYPDVDFKDTLFESEEAIAAIQREVDKIREAFRQQSSILTFEDTIRKAVEMGQDAVKNFDDRQMRLGDLILQHDGWSGTGVKVYIHGYQVAVLKRRNGKTFFEIFGEAVPRRWMAGWPFRIRLFE